MTIPHSAATDVGQRREHNEDTVLAADPLFVVCDGVGGSAKGEVASATAAAAVEGARDALLAAATTADAVHVMNDAVHAANLAVIKRQQDDATLEGMATTLTAMLVRDGGDVVVGHVGDSRCYAASGTHVQQLSDDHSVVGELMRAGELTADDAAQHPQRNVITRALGIDASLTVDAFAVHPGPGEWLVLCSDGLTNHVEDHELATTISSQLEQHSYDAAAAAPAITKTLVDLANERGGSDNISVIVCQPVPADASGSITLAAIAASDDLGSGDSPIVTENAVQADAVTVRAGATGEQPAVLPISPASTRDELSSLQEPIKRKITAVVLTVIAVMIAAGCGAYAWSHSYYLVERSDGRLGIERGWPVLGMHKPYRTTDLVIEDLPQSLATRTLESPAIMSRSDAELRVEQLDRRAEVSES